MTKRALAVCLFLCGPLACSSNGSAERGNPDPPPQPPPEATAELFPSFTLPNLAGEEISLNDFRGKVVLVVFWASWCRPCVAEVPDLNRFLETYGERGLEVVAVAVDPRESREKILRFVDDKGVRYRVLKGSNETGRRYNVRGIPTSYLVGRSGEVLEQFVGYAKPEVVEQAIISALGE